MMSQAILCIIARQLQQAEFFTIMTDECVDGANKELLVICFRYVDENADVHEEFIGLYEYSNILANTIVARLQDIMLRLNLQLSRCRRLCYDGGSNMAGYKSGVKAQILQQELCKRLALFKDIKAEISPDSVGFCVLCPTRLTVCSETFQSILDNYSALLELWVTILNDKPDSEIRA